jgi:acyl-CoA synthetase (AMP-forming)/AMP-acid ligase II
MSRAAAGRTAGDILAASAARAPGGVAVIEAGPAPRALTYGELDEAADRIAGALAARGLGLGATVAVLSHNRLEYPALFFGIARAGAFQAHASVRYTEAELIDVLGRAGARLLFVDAGLLALARAARRHLPALESLVVLGPAPGLESGEVAVADFLAAAGPAPPPLADPDAPFCVTFTGGTTGRPKGVVVSHRCRTAVAEALTGPFEMRPGAVAVLCTPLFHVAGLFSWHLTAMAGGATLVLLPRWDVAAFMDAVARHGATQACMVPTQAVSLFNAPGFDAAKLATLKLINYGGAPMPEVELRRALAALPGLAMLEHYGQSEAGAIAWRPPARALEKSASVGVAVPGMALAVLDAAGVRLPPGAAGEIAVKGPGVFLGYLGDAAETRRAIRADGWLLTGDIGRLDADGFLTLVDRAKDMIIAGGENIYPAEIENALYAHPAVGECAVFGVPDATWGELPAAHVVLRAGAVPDEAALIAFVAERIARHKRPRFVKFVPALPKTAIGKVQKNEIRRLYWPERAK